MSRAEPELKMIVNAITSCYLQCLLRKVGRRIIIDISPGGKLARDDHEDCVSDL